MRDPHGFTISDLADDAGYWTANVTVNGRTVQVHRRYGSWQSDVGEAGQGTRDVGPLLAEALQARVLPVERGRRKAATA